MRTVITLSALLLGIGSGGQAHKPAPASATPMFATIKAADPAVAKALNATDLAGGKKLVDKEGAFKGTVSKVFKPKGGKIVVLDFAPNFREAMTAVCKNADSKEWPPLDSLNGKHVLISGKFEIYRDAPQIILLKPSQLKLIK